MSNIELYKGQILHYKTKYDSSKIKKGVIVDIYNKNNYQPYISKYIKLKSLSNNLYWEIPYFSCEIVGIFKPKKRRSNFRIVIDRYLDEKSKIL